MTDSAPHPKPAPADLSFLPGPVLLLGAPGVGKGTQAQLLMAAFGIPQISTGDILRTVKSDPTKSQTPEGAIAKSLMDQGLLVPDNVVNKLVVERLARRDTGRGFILDGFPRTLNQAIWIDHHLAAAAAALPIVAIHIIVGYDELLHRITGRRTCPICKSIYNIYSNPPKTPGRCDYDGAELIQRPDDTEPVFIQRMKTFQDQTAPVIEHYRAQGRFREVNGDQPVELVASAITLALRQLRLS